jgi:hypothetical protein
MITTLVAYAMVVEWFDLKKYSLEIKLIQIWLIWVQKKK